MPARIAPAEPPYRPEVQDQFDRLMPGKEPLVLFRVLARDARLFGRFMGGGLLDKGALTLREREIVIHRICALNGSEYEWGVHAALFADRTGLTEEQLAAIVHLGPDAPCWPEREALLIRFCDAANATVDVDDDLWAALSGAFGEAARLELLMLAGFYRTVSLLTRALRLPLEPWARRLAPAPH